MTVVEQFEHRQATRASLPPARGLSTTRAPSGTRRRTHPGWAGCHRIFWPGNGFHIAIQPGLIWFAHVGQSMAVS